MLFSFAALNDYNEGDGEGAREGRVTFPLLKEERSVAHTRAHVMYFASLDLVLRALIWGAALLSPLLSLARSKSFAFSRIVSHVAPADDYKERYVSRSKVTRQRRTNCTMRWRGALTQLCKFLSGRLGVKANVHALMLFGSEKLYIVN